MRKPFYILLLLNCAMSVSNCFGQVTKIDSLLIILKTAKDDTAKVNTLNDLFLEYEFSDDVKSREYLDKALELSKKTGNKKGLAATYNNMGYFSEDKGDYPEALKNFMTALQINETINYQNGIATVYSSIGSIYYAQGDYPLALKNYFSSLKIADEIGDKTALASSYNNIGLVYTFQGNYPEALKNYFASLKIREATGDKAGIAATYNNIGIVYTSQKSFAEALSNYYASLKIYQDIDDKRRIAITYNNIGLVFYDQTEDIRDPALRKNKLELALKNNLSSLKISEEIGDKKSIADSYNNNGNIYFSLAEFENSPSLIQGKLELALKNHFTSLKMRNEIGDTAGIASAYCNIGTVLLKQEKFKEAQEYLTKAKDLAKKIGFYEYLRNACNALTQVDSAENNFKGAYENHKLYILYRDSLDNVETRKKTIQSQMTYDFEKKEAVADAEHKKELENQKLLAEEKSRKQMFVIGFVVAGLLLVLVFAGFVFRSLRLTRKQKAIIEEQKELVEEKQKEILDSIYYARRIQRSLLPTDKYIERSMKRLKNIF